MSRSQSWCVFVCSFLLLFSTAEAGVLVSEKSTWRSLKGRTEASTPDTTAWRQIGFSDAAWASSAAPFYYGENVASGTLLNDMRYAYSTVYLRKVFPVTNVSQIAIADFDAISDDGFIAWINGRQVASKSPPAVVTYKSLASRNATEPVAWETTRVTSPETLFQEGDNIVAVQLFNITTNSSDILFDMQLFTILKETIPPTVAAVSPFPGTVTNLTNITVTFSEPVTGVDAGDLRINDVAAQSVTGTGATYTFRFAQPPFGPVQVSWSQDANIQDLTVPPNLFSISGENSNFLYELVDPSIPMVAVVHPPEGAIVRALAQVEIQFNKVVEEVDAGDLLINNVAATNMSGLGAGPYIFQFPVPNDGPVQLSWANNHGIIDLTPQRKPLQTQPWSYQLDQQAAIPLIVINEISAANMTGLRDEDASAEDWIELYNAGNTAVNLQGWSISDDPDLPGQWVFPPVTIEARSYLVIFASGKDRRTLTGGRLHANFKLSAAGEYLGFFTPDSPRIAAMELVNGFPEQRNDHSYGQVTSNDWRYFVTPTPGLANGQSTISGVTEPVYFSVKRGYFNSSFQLSLHSPTPGAEIRYTLDGSEPTLTNGIVYTNLVLIDRTRIVRAAAFAPGSLPSRTETHTYLFNIAVSRKFLPAMSLVTATNHLYGATGIMEYNPRNTTKHGIAWERPISVELIRPQDNEGFQIDCGIRIQGGNYVRDRYSYAPGTGLPFSKYSYRLYFRGDYGASKLEYRLFPDIPLRSFDEVVLRAGMNDHSNPYIKDEMVRMLAADVGIVSPHGTFVHLFLNGIYKGLYNPTERISAKFLQQWHGGGEAWDLIAQNGEVREGNNVAWNALKNLANTQSPATPATYVEIGKRLDLINFIDYLLPLIYADNDDWPWNNWRAGRERVPEGKFRFYVWDAEWAFGFNNAVSNNTITDQLAQSTEIGQLFNRLRLSPEFRLLFADRAHKHFYNGGALTDEKIRARYQRIKGQVLSSISGFNDVIGTTWIPQRRRYVTNHLAAARLLLSSNAPVLNQFSGRVARGFELTMSASDGTIYFTTNGFDPRVQFTAQVHPGAQAYARPFPITSSLVLKARTLNGTNWSAVTAAEFQVDRLGIPLRITEIMYNPVGGDAYEFIEIQNIGGSSVPLGGMTMLGVDFRFPENTPSLVPGARIVLISDFDPAAFAQRYPNVQIAGTYSATSSLSNGGEPLAIKDPLNNIIHLVKYDDENGWPKAADGGGYSLEMIDPEEDGSVPANWQASAELGGTPGRANAPSAATPAARLNELMAENLTAVSNGQNYPDWIELHNSSNGDVDLGGWSIIDDSAAPRFVFPPMTVIPAGGYLVLWCDSDNTAGGIHTGFALGRNGETVFLYDAGTNRVDALTYGIQLADFSIGRSGDGKQWELNFPTPGAPNESAPLAAPADLVINELMANPPAGAPDWVELFNLNADNPAAIGGFYLGLSNVISQLPALSFIAPNGFAQIFADEETGPNRVSFRLPASGEKLTLYDSLGAPIAVQAYGSQAEGASLGRLPNGTGPMITFTVTVSPGASNYAQSYSGPALNEILARNQSLAHGGLVNDWIELFNPLATDFDLGGMSLSINKRIAGQWRFPPNAIIPAAGYLVINCDIISPPALDFSQGGTISPKLDDTSGGVYLFTPSGQLADLVEYGFQVPDMSIGRVGGSWVLTQSPTRGAVNSAPAPLGSLTNLSFNEWMAAPLAGDDWVELYNADPLSVQIGGLYLTDDPSTYGRTNTPIRLNSFVPGNGFVLFQTDGEQDKGSDHTGFSLDRYGETLRLYGPSFVIIDEMNLLAQQAGISEGLIPDGGTQIIAFPNRATPGASNVAPSLDSDGDGMPDDWENLHGLAPFGASDAALDPDSDGLSNLDEYRAGTNPKDATSALQFTATDIAGAQVVLKFNAKAGRSYTILYKDDLAGATWQRLSNVDALATDQEAQVPDMLQSTTRFYQIVTPLQP